MKRTTPLRTPACLSAAILAAALVIGADPAVAQAPAGATGVVAGRPAADKARDADRKRMAMMQFAEVKPGETVIDYLPGKGYFTRVLSDAVGSEGVVYAVWDQRLIDRLKGKPLPPPVSGEPGRGNVRQAVAAGGTLGVPEKVDLVWTAQNYHDVHIWAGPQGAEALDKAAFDALKPGGLYVIVDHAGAQGLDEAGIAKLHRIDEAVVKAEAEAAGFVLDGESTALRNSADPHTVPVFDPTIRGETDQFALRFRKPG